MQGLPFLGFELFQRLQTDLKMLADTLPVEVAGHTGELDFSVKRSIRHAKQRAVGHAEAKAVGGDCRRLHVERNSARLRQPPNDGRIADFPIAIVHARDGSGAHHALWLEALEPGDLADGLLKRDLHLCQRRYRRPQRQFLVEDVTPHIAVRETALASSRATRQGESLVDGGHACELA